MSTIDSESNLRSRRASARRTAIWVALTAVAVYVGFMAMAITKAL